MGVAMKKAEHPNPTPLHISEIVVQYSLFETALKIEFLRNAFPLMTLMTNKNTRIIEQRFMNVEVIFP